MAPIFVIPAEAAQLRRAGIVLRFKRPSRRTIPALRFAAAGLTQPASRLS